MREITPEILERKIATGVVRRETLQRMLEAERKYAELTVTMPTLGLFDCEFAAREASAAAYLEESRQRALVNIPILERLLLQMGADIAPPARRKLACGHYSSEKMTTSRGSSCPDCYDRMSE